MKNIDKIRQMTTDELAELLGGACENFCTGNCLLDDCVVSIKKWLEQEVKE